MKDALTPFYAILRDLQVKSLLGEFSGNKICIF